MIRNDNMEFAEKLLKEAEDYIKTAMRHVPNDPDIHARLGYIYKDLALRHIHTNEKRDRYLNVALGHFNAAIGIDNKNASVHNGRASVYIIQANYDDAIKESEIAVQLQPKYLFAYHDLALANYMKVVGQDTTEIKRYEDGFFKAYERVVSLDGSDAGSLPPKARKQIDSMAKKSKQYHLGLKVNLL